jgi:hypothetical protein
VSSAETATRGDSVRPADALMGAATVALFSCFALASRAGPSGALHAWDLAALRDRGA